MLTWLVNQVNYLWAKIRSSASDALAWAKREAGKALDKAKAWANEAIAWLKVHLTNLVNAARNAAGNLFNQAIAFAADVFNRAVTAARTLVDGVYGIIDRVVAEVYAFIVRGLNTAATAARLLVDGVYGILDRIVAEIYAFIVRGLNSAATAAQAIIDGVVGIINGTIARIESSILALGVNAGQDDPTQRSNLLAFISNPLGFTLALIFDYLLIMLEWALAYAIGTVNEDLPPRPDWSGAGVGGVIVPGTGPPPGASGLASPLSHLRVSGHTFRTGHPGIDLGLTVGTPVYAMHNGAVLFAGWDSLNYGLTIIVQGREWWTRYAHLSQIMVTAGQTVMQSHVIGLGGSTGNSTGPHLHLEIKHNGRFIDPLSVL